LQEAPPGYSRKNLPYDETTDTAVDFIKRQVATGKPFFCSMNTTRVHLRANVRADHRDKPGLTARTEYADDMIEHDGHVRQITEGGRRSWYRQ
jgi:hypothetical protein